MESVKTFLSDTVHAVGHGIKVAAVWLGRKIVLLFHWTKELCSTIFSPENLQKASDYIKETAMKVYSWLRTRDGQLFSALALFVGCGTVAIFGKNWKYRAFGFMGSIVCLAFALKIIYSGY